MMSTAEAEYLVLGSPVQEFPWISHIFCFATGSPSPMVVIKVDNQESPEMARNGASGKENGLVNIEFHSTGDLGIQKEFELEFCPTTDVIADILTKPLGRTLFQKSCMNLGLQ